MECLRCGISVCGMFGIGMFEMWDVCAVACSRCGMFEMWDVWYVGCWGCGMLGMKNAWDVGGSGCGMLGMWDVGCGMFTGMWDLDLLNAKM